MKKIFALALMSSVLLSTAHAQQDKSQRASPPAVATQKIKSGSVITINYSQPSLKGRTIGQDLEPKKGKVWRMGANEATVFETSRDITVEGKTLKEGRYSLFGLLTDDGITLIFNEAADIWGTTYEKNKDKDVLKINVPVKTAGSSKEKLEYTIDPSGKVSLQWGTMLVDFQVK